MRLATPCPRLISIHALHEESDLTLKNLSFNNRIFQSTLSMRRATAGGAEAALRRGISIHALHEESDQIRLGWRACCRISIHALHEESDHVSP